MSGSSRKAQSFFYSLSGIIVMGILLVAINIIASQMHLRTDLTEDKLYTLSSGSEQILADLKSPVTLRFYCTRGKNEMPVYLKGFAKRIEDLLKEYQIAGDGKIKIEKYDPLPDSDAEDAAALDGIDGQQLTGGEKIYLGIAVNCIDETQSIPFLSPNNEKTLEYDITRLILRVSNPSTITVGVMSSLPVMGGPSMVPGRPPPRQGQPPWVFVTELKKDYEVREVELSAEAIPDDISILIVIHPKNITDKTSYAIDQFVLRGGKLIALVDPLSVIEGQFTPQDPMRPTPPGSSTLKKLFGAWGVEFNAGKIVADMIYPTEISGQGGERQVSPVVLSLDERAMNSDEIISGSLSKAVFAYAGVFSGGDPSEGLSKTILLKSSSESQLIDSYKAQLPGDAISRDFESDNREQALAIKLIGKFKSAFKDGPPESEDESSPGVNPDDASNKEKKSPSLMESEKSGAVVLIGDADMIYDDFWVRKTNFLGHMLHQVFSDNNNLLQNTVEQLSGDSSLISVRSRGLTSRPFLVVKNMQLEAEKKYKHEISRLEDEVAEAQRKINELQSTKKDQSQRFILSKEQAKELEKFREKRVEVNKKLKDLRKQLRRDVNRLENTLKLCNIGLIPLIVSVAGILFAILRKRKTTAR